MNEQDKLLNHLTSEHQELIRKMSEKEAPESLIDEIVKNFLKMDCPEVLLSIFREKVTEIIVPLIKKMANEYMVSLEGKSIRITFPGRDEAVVGTNRIFIELIDMTPIEEQKGQYKNSLREIKLKQSGQMAGPCFWQCTQYWGKRASKRKLLVWFFHLVKGIV